MQIGASHQGHGGNGEREADKPSRYAQRGPQARVPVDHGSNDNKVDRQVRHRQQAISVFARIPAGRLGKFLLAARHTAPQQGARYQRTAHSIFERSLSRQFGNSIADLCSDCPLSGSLTHRASQ